MDLKQLAKRKLKEFHRWCRVAVLHYDMIQVDENWTVKLFEFDPEDYKGRIYDWQREAPEEVNEIIKAVNAIARPRHRAILIMSYISPKRYVQQSRRNNLVLSHLLTTWPRIKLWKSLPVSTVVGY